MKLNKITLVVMAAGMGSRYGGIKQLDAIGESGETILEYGLYDALLAGFDDVVFLIRRELEDDFRNLVLSRLPSDLVYRVVFQELDDLPAPFDRSGTPTNRQKPWGTAHAVWSARKAVANPFAVINADDFYGRTSYRRMGGWLKTTDAWTTHYALLGYELQNTLSDNGAVSRGICEVNSQGFLVRIEEHTHLSRGASGVVESHREGAAITPFPLETVVSMNLFGLTPQVFPQLEHQIGTFLEAFSADPKRECYLPGAIGELVSQGDVSVSVLPCSEVWFGVTYPQDRIEVVSHIRKMVGAGLYPRSLWGNR